MLALAKNKYAMKPGDNWGPKVPTVLQFVYVAQHVAPPTLCIMLLIDLKLVSFAVHPRNIVLDLTDSCESLCFGLPMM